MTDTSDGCKGFFCRLWRALKSPSAKYSLGFLIVIVFTVTSVFWIGFHWAMDATNTETSHYSNRTGVRATCPDCHVPKEWHHKIVRKIKSTNEMMHKLLGSISTPEKYEAKRLELAEKVWANMQATDSRECRNCHGFEYMDFSKQGEEPAEIHPEALEADMTCIDCHKGIAHKLPEGYED